MYFITQMIKKCKKKVKNTHNMFYQHYIKNVKHNEVDKRYSIPYPGT